MGPVQGVWGGDGGSICGGTHDDSAWARGRIAMELEDFGHGGIDADISNSPPSQGMPVELPGVRMPRPSGKADGDAGSLPIPACHGHCGNSGGGKHPPTTVNPMQHSGTPAGTERQAPCHSSVRQGIGAKEAADRGGGSE